jgi:undecaprenyl-diphosphatase
MDERLTITLNHMFTSPFMEYMSEPTHWIVPALILVATMIAIDRRRGMATSLGALIAVSVGDAGSQWLIKETVQRPRPCHDIAEIIHFVGCSSESYSFPSNHAVNVFALAMVIGLGFRGLRYPALLFAATVGLSRVALGVHYVSDVIGGALIGGVVGYLVATLLLRWFAIDSTEPVDLSAGPLQGEP